MILPLHQYYTLLHAYLWPQWRRLFWLGILLLAGIGLQLLPPQLMGRFLDLATTSGSLTTLTWLAAWVIGAVLVQQICTVLAAYLGEDVAWRATNGLRDQLMTHCLHLDLAFHHAHTPGEMIERIDSDVTLLANFFSQFVVLILGNLLLLLGVLGLLFQVDWRIGLVGLALALTLLSLLARLRNLGIPSAVAHRQANAELYAYLEERLGGLEDLRANGAVDYTMQRFYTLLRTVFHKSLWENWTFSLPFAVMIILVAVGTGGVLALCAYLYQRNAMTIGTIYLVFHYITLLSTPINALTRQMEDLQRAGGSIVRLQALQGTTSKLVEDVGVPSPAGAERPGGVTTPSVATSKSVVTSKAVAVRFADVTFGYAVDTPVLQNISFHLPPGKQLGLLGRTGSGKSSLARLLLRLYDPDQGCIMLGDEQMDDLRQLPLAQVRQQVGLVTQHVQLFHATLRDNLTFWDPAISDSQLYGALDELGLMGWLKTLPAGLETVLTAGGGNLSAGEAQLVAFARIFLRNPALVILDEASSRLDPVTETRLATAIERLLAGRTAIIIAHRLATVQHVDEIMILDKGRVVEYGERTALAANPASRFTHLLQTGFTEVLA
ncbi:MAG: ABC transporter ATP-binding protein [Caldilinea sp. CFX5]|nr:ABC transporter ATP-binding protein [Caldilinea sp. CFX5]